MSKTEHKGLQGLIHKTCAAVCGSSTLHGAYKVQTIRAGCRDRPQTLKPLRGLKKAGKSFVGPYDKTGTPRVSCLNTRSEVNCFSEGRGACEIFEGPKGGKKWKLHPLSHE
jgi:hypothetical protein